MIFPLLIITASFIFKQKITDQTGNDGIKDVEIMVSFKYLSNIWRTLEMPLINSEINLVLTWSPNCIMVAKYEVLKFFISSFISTYSFNTFTKTKLS